MLEVVVMKPISPAEVIEAKRAAIPSEVIEIFNEHIGRNWDGHVSVVVLSDVAEEICAKLDLTREELRRQHLLDVEPLYRAGGWKVVFDRPGYNESGKSTYTFTAK